MPRTYFHGISGASSSNGSGARRFGNDLDTALDAVAEQPIAAKVIERFARSRLRNTIQCFAYLSQYRF